ncbi:MAG: RNA-binding transcriptional accessory protein [Ruminococcaceae bacterium]|nr:RNA-binding transcriptional accessory protein [Oscillospiraceae bacterium]
MDILQTLSEEFSIPMKRLEDTVALIDEGNTIPFIARYRKEVTGSLDDTVLRGLFDRLTYLRSLEERREKVRETIAEQGKLTDEISEALDNAVTLTEIEDIYRPFKQKRKTRASVAREKGLAPLAELIAEQRESYEPSLLESAEAFIDEEKGVVTVEEALAGAMDIIAEDISDNAEYRKEIRAITFNFGFISSSASTEESTVYDMYYDYREPIRKTPSHRILAMNRGEKEDILKVKIEIAKDAVLNYLFKAADINMFTEATTYMAKAAIDSYERLIAPSIEREIRSDLFDEASEGAIKLFSENLKNLLMQPPVKGKTALGFDPGYRTGCKLAVVDKTGKVLDTAVIYPTKPQERIEESKRVVKRLVEKHGVEIIAIGNGTASKESEIFIAGLLRELPGKVQYAMVSEAGASVYSASEAGAEEFPDFDVTERSAVSIARRLQNPLAELVKIDPKAIGVGQYQHDMKPARLDAALGGVVEDCVNSVGVDINTASYSLLSYIAGINMTTAKNIVKYREENGEFTKRSQILKVPKIGAKAYQQCAGFLRVASSSEILDNTGVHPESYEIAKKLIARYNYTSDDVKQSRLSELGNKVRGEGIAKVAGELECGEPTLLDIVGELEKPGRDVRDSLPQPILREDVMGLEDLTPGMLMTGTVRNVIDFGAFVDIGVHQDGLVHISEISNKFIKHPSQVLSVGDNVQVKVLSVDTKKGRISLTMKI